MNTSYNKEDMGLAKDIESGEDIFDLYGQELDDALDIPLNRMKFLFPNKKYPEKSVRDIKLRVMSCYIDIPDNILLSEITAMWMLKTGKSKLELDIYVNAIIDADYKLMVEMETEASLLLVKKNAHDLSEDAQMRNSLYTTINDDFLNSDIIE